MHTLWWPFFSGVPGVKKECTGCSDLKLHAFHLFWNKQAGKTGVGLHVFFLWHPAATCAQLPFEKRWTAMHIKVLIPSRRRIGRRWLRCRNGPKLSQCTNVIESFFRWNKLTIENDCQILQLLMRCHDVNEPLSNWLSSELMFLRPQPPPRPSESWVSWCWSQDGRMKHHETHTVP